MEQNKKIETSLWNKRTLLCSSLGLVWLIGILSGTQILFDYENRPAHFHQSPEIWPKAASIPRTPGKPVLVLFAHPQCPCTRATVGELALLMARLKDDLTAHVIFIRPSEMPENWEQTDLWRTAASIPGVSVMSDPGGVEATRFHAQVSGQTMLYNADGRLLFSGGITASRGHSGDNAGRSAIVALVSKGKSGRTTTPVFGCYLQAQDLQQDEKVRNASFN
jgi:hypothetical protein